MLSTSLGFPLFWFLSIKSLINHALSSPLLLGANYVSIFGTDVPLVVAGLGLGIASSMTNDFVHSWILPMISTDQKLSYFEGIATGIGAGAGSMLLYSYLAEPNLLSTPGAAQLALVGAATEIASQYVYERLAVMFGLNQGDLLL